METITNPICVGCLENQIREWLSYRAPQLMSIFGKGMYFGGASEGTRCIKCKQTMNVCTYCFAKDVMELLSAHDPDLLDEYLSMFDFGLKEAMV